MARTKQTTKTRKHCYGAQCGSGGPLESSLNKNKATAINRAVNRGIGKSLADGKKYQGSLDLSFYATLYSMVLDSSTKVLNLKLVRNLLVYSFLGFAIQRAQSATVNTITKLKNPERVLLRRNVVIDRDRYCIWWALTHSKGDPFGRRKGKDRLDWTVTAGSRAGGKHQHPIDIVALYLIYCQMMGFPADKTGRVPGKDLDTPFFQELDRHGRPTGEPLSYTSCLYGLKADIKQFFPELDPSDYGTHTFRRFGATYAKAKGIPDDLIMLMGRWVSECWRRYLLFSDDSKVQMSRDMLGD